MRNAALIIFGLALMLAPLLGCDFQQPDQAEVDAPADVQQAAEFLSDEWAERLGLDIDHDVPPISWFEGPCLTWDWVAEQDPCVAGAYWSGDQFDTTERVEVVYDEQISRTTLAHELLHWSLHRSTGNPDNDHTGPEWAQVERVRYALYLAGQ